MKPDDGKGQFMLADDFETELEGLNPENVKIS